jgi:GH35 family endo-1,4-beta-xylanase
MLAREQHMLALWVAAAAATLAPWGAGAASGISTPAPPAPTIKMSATRFPMEGGAAPTIVCPSLPLPGTALRARMNEPSTTLRFPTRYPIIQLPKPKPAANGCISVEMSKMSMAAPAKTDDVGLHADPPAPQLLQLPSLRELAAKQDLFMGTCIDSSFVAGTPRTVMAASQFSIVTAEGEMKWAFTQPDNSTGFAWSGGDKIVAAAQINKQRIRGHNLAWDIANPKWLYQTNFTGAQLRTMLRTHTAAVVGRWKGKIYSWDVINEGISSHPTPHLKKGMPPWCGSASPPSDCQTTVWWPASNSSMNYIDMAFHWAHAADPAAKLFWNDGCAEGREPKAATVYTAVKGMLARGVPIHGVGLEMHFKLHTDGCSEGYQSPADVEANMRQLAALGLEIHVTEMTVELNLTATGDISRVQGNMTFVNASAVLHRQAEVYAGILRACLNVPLCKSWGVWGFYGRHHKVVFDAELQAKPTFWALVAELKKGRPLSVAAKTDDGTMPVKPAAPPGPAQDLGPASTARPNVVFLLADGATEVLDV